jgi:hypothetical protein
MMEKDMGAIPGSREPDPASGSGPAGFDPARIDDLTLARAMGGDLRNEIASIVCGADTGVGRDHLLGRHYLAADRIFEAIAAATRRAKTPQAVECEASQSGGESRIAQEDAPSSDMGKGE